MDNRMHLTKGYGTAAVPYTFPGSVPLVLRGAFSGDQPARKIIPLKTGTLNVQNDDAAFASDGTTPVYETLDIVANLVGFPLEGKFRSIKNDSTANAFIVQW